MNGKHIRIISLREEPNYLERAISYFHEKFGFSYIGNCYHPRGEQTRVYQLNI